MDSEDERSPATAAFNLEQEPMGTCNYTDPATNQPRTKQTTKSECDAIPGIWVPD
jgi:hypothetical protein